jgi:hydrogenase nickel incorporation protein HypA/HybF
MHELSLAAAIVAIAEQHAAGRRIARVEVRVGQLRQVVPDALLFAFEFAASDTLADGAQLVLEHVPATGDCRACGARSELPGFPLACGTCGTLDLEVVTGEELCVDALDVIAADAAPEEVR